MHENGACIASSSIVDQPRRNILRRRSSEMSTAMTHYSTTTCSARVVKFCNQFWLWQQWRNDRTVKSRLFVKRRSRFPRPISYNVDGILIDWDCHLDAVGLGGMYIWCRHREGEREGVPQKPMQKGSLVMEVAWKCRQGGGGNGEGVKKIGNFCRRNMYMPPCGPR